MSQYFLNAFLGYIRFEIVAHTLIPHWACYEESVIYSNPITSKHRSYKAPLNKPYQFKLILNWIESLGIEGIYLPECHTIFPDREGTFHIQFAVGLILGYFGIL